MTLPDPEPRFSRIAAMLANPTRARMLAALLGGEYRSAGELAKRGGITPQAATTQLAQMLDAGLLATRTQGRHKYFALANADVAHALESLSIVAERDDVSRRWQQPRYQPLKRSRRCYDHLAGELGVAQFEMLLRCAYLAQTPHGLALTAAGQKWATIIGLKWVAPTTDKAAQRAAYPCLDWSERKDHLAGSLATALLAHYVQKDWLLSSRESRALPLTPKGERELLPLLGISGAGHHAG